VAKEAGGETHEKIESEKLTLRALREEGNSRSVESGPPPHKGRSDLQDLGERGKGANILFLGISRVSCDFVQGRRREENAAASSEKPKTVERGPIKRPTQGKNWTDEISTAKRKGE